MLLHSNILVPQVQYHKKRKFTLEVNYLYNYKQQGYF